ncbi:hypothetical protein F442_22665 [Phytophthora nicotianae P10297]|uniref:Uncharacterized protein n=1 Tax=Phytophthora nicotianae P10297 TaxID=1317064 RepID=W2XZA3_PHYNI|nr:hypothetical protein F442_22665 [Phytophthora nicotianae P10297]
MGVMREKRRAERIVDGGTPTWRFIWSQLKASGWTHKLPPASSIETRWKFVPPGGNPFGIEGKDYFLGEDRVLAHYAAGNVACDESEEDEYELVPRHKRTLQLGPTASTTHGTSLFGSSEDESGGEATAHDGVSGDHHCVSEASSIMSSDSDDELNKIEEEDDPDDNAGFESGDEIEEDSIVDTDNSDQEGEDAAAGTARDCEEEVGDSEEENPNSAESIAERHFAEKFLESLGGPDKLLAGTGMSKQDLEKLREHSVTGWTDRDTPDVYESLQMPYQATGEENRYPDLRKEPFGPTPDALKCRDSPLLFSSTSCQLHFGSTSQ